MERTPMERRKEICALAEADAEYQRIKAEYDRAQQLFEAFVLTLPDEQRNLLRAFPGMGYFLHSRMLTIVSETMTFPDETQ